MNDPITFTDKLHASARQSQILISRAISDAVCEMVDEIVLPELIRQVGTISDTVLPKAMSDGDKEEIASVVTELLTHAVAALGVHTPFPRSELDERIFGRFKQHIAGECADDEDTLNLLRRLSCCLNVVHTYTGYIVEPV